MVRISIIKSHKLVEVLRASLRGVTGETIRLGDNYLTSSREYAMQIEITRGGGLHGVAFKVMGLAALRDAAIAIAAGKVPDEPRFDLHIREDYSIQLQLHVVHGSNAAKQMQHEKDLLEPFVEHWWGGFHKLEVIGGRNKETARQLLLSARSEKWASVAAFDKYLESAVSESHATWKAGDLEAANDSLRNTLGVHHITKRSPQKSAFFDLPRGSRRGLSLDVRAMTLGRGLLYTNLQLARQAETKRKCIRLATEALECGLLNTNEKELRSFVPETMTLCNTYCQIAEAYRLLEDVVKAEHYLDKAEKNLPSVILQSPAEGVLKSLARELVEIRKRMSRNVAVGQPTSW